MTDIHFVYGLANGNFLEASRRYEMYHQRAVSYYTLFARLYQRLRETEAFTKKYVSGNAKGEHQHWMKQYLI